MKTFYEMMMILEKAKGLNENRRGGGWASAWDDYGWQDSIRIHKVLGEDDDDPFTLEVDITEEGWEVLDGGIFVVGYVPNGSENPASKPEAYTDDQLSGSRLGTLFRNPGKKLELLPASIKAAAVDWVDKQAQEAIENYDPYEGSPEGR